VVPATATLSVVLPVYAGAPVAFLGPALASVAAQTRPADQVVVVEDGPLPPAHRDVLERAGRALPLERVTLPTHRGVSAALQAGLTAATGTWVARADADDLLLPERFDRQLAELDSSAPDVLGTAMYEFEDDPDHPTALRRMPRTHEAIRRMMRTANPINHPTVMFRREAAVEAGGYRGPDGLEDYDLWVRLSLQGARFHNLAEPLVRFRSDQALLDRRRSAALLRAEVQLQRRFVEYGFENRPRAVLNVLVRNGYRVLPPRVMRRVNRLVFSR
jgi:glycosyltransferase involved in cell wall biosynthesis